MATAQDVLTKLAALAGEDEAVLGSNNTTVNKYFNAPGAPYCGYAIWYAMKKAGCSALDDCDNPAYVPTIKSYLAGKGWKVPNDQARAGDIFVYKDDHVGFVYEHLSGTAVITLEGNSTVYKTPACSGTAFEGIGYKKRVLTSDYTVYRPTYDGTSKTDTSPNASTGSTAAGSSSVDYTAKVTEFQEWLGVDPNGKYGPETEIAATYRLLLALLELRPLKYGDSGTAVMILQYLLYAAGYDPKGADGQYGGNTKAAVLAIQKAEGLKEDGEAGKNTFAVLPGM